MIQDKKELQKRRMMSYFLEAAHKIIDEDGIGGLNIRRVADLAGYNSATLYNYFENLEHLIFYASMKYLGEYIKALPACLESAKTYEDKFFAVWECFSRFSFNNPVIFNILFFEKYSESLKETVREYYEIFPEELEPSDDELLPMLMEKDFYNRNLALLKLCIDDSSVSSTELKELNEMIVLIYQGMLSRMINTPDKHDPESETQKILRFIRIAMRSFC